MTTPGVGSSASARSGEQVFVRRSSGLTRQVSARDALAYSAMNPGLLYAFIYAVWMIPLFASSGGVNLSFVTLGVLIMFPVAGLYWFYSTAMPRSGGEYVYISRTLHPVLGLFANWMLTITALSWFGQLTDWWIKWGLADSFTAVGIRNNSTAWISVGTWFEGQWQRTLIGTLAMLLMLWIFFKGTRLMMRLSYLAILASWVAVVVLGIVVLTTSNASFVGSFQSLTGIQISQVVDYAHSSGVFGLTVGATILGGVTYVVLNTLGNTFSASIAGEIRGVQKSQAIAMFGALIVAMATWALAYNTVFHGFGGHGVWSGLSMAFNDGTNFYPFGGSEAHNAAALGEGLGSSREPFPTLLLAFTGGGPVIIFLFALGFMVSTFMSAGGLGFAPIRNVFAWSFDRLIPTKFAELDRRYRAPWLALCSVTFVGWLFFMVDVWKPAWMTYISFTIAAWMIGWLVLGISGMLFPVARPQLFGATPPIVQRGLPTPMAVGGVLVLAIAAVIVSLTAVNATVAEIALVAAVGAFGVIGLAYVGRAHGSVPYISLLGWGTFAIAGFIEWSILLPFFPSGGEPAAQSWSALSPIPIMMVCPFVIYGLATYAARQRQIPLKLQFAEVPPE